MTREGYKLSVQMNFVDPDNLVMGEVIWNTYGYDNQGMDIVGSRLIQTMLGTAAEMREEKAAEA